MNIDCTYLDEWKDENIERFYFLKESYNKKILSFKDAYEKKHGDDGTFDDMKWVTVNTKQEKQELLDRCHHVVKMTDDISKLWNSLDDDFSNENIEGFGDYMDKWYDYIGLYGEQDIEEGYLIDIAVDLELYQKICDLHHKIMTKFEPMVEN
jgi:hypothetical protein